MKWTIVYSKQARKDSKKVSVELKPKIQSLVQLLEENPLQLPPFYEKLGGDLLGYYSRRINKQHRLVYKIYDAEKTVKIIRMWTHYE